ncbi:hypothetical protein C1H46_013112 [Malus baccata]|uniref:Uncharacterized protein n=1 Tax=Malus baccata TaxID=106549 RepID=A0A540MR65_MALBA|nr:hypothetical protein C1H46_013112 [Malus baccata]
MAPKSKRNTAMSGNASDTGKAASQLDESQHEGQRQESQENLDEYDMPDIIVAIYALGKAQKEIVAFVKKLKNSILKPNKKASDNDCRQRKGFSG